MHVFLYEWITGGGLVEHVGRLPASLLAEGTAIISALAADFNAIPGCRPTLIRDLRLTEFEPRRCQIVDVDSTLQWRTEFTRCVSEAELTVIVAPEFDGILLQTAQIARDAGGRLLNSSDDFIAIASRKDLTADRLAAVGVPSTEGCILDADEEILPVDFTYPGVLKPLDGAGSQNTFLVESSRDLPDPYPWPRRLEKFYCGRPASVAVLCGPAGNHALRPCWQRLSDDNRFSYRGGALILESPLARRAQSLALRAVAALPAAVGYIGVDLILGDAADGSRDVVIEINPRLSTSYVGLRAATDSNLAQAMLDVAVGKQPQIHWTGDAVEFLATGEVWRN